MLDAERISALSDAWTFLRWQQLLLDGGLLFELPQPVPKELEALAEVQDRLTVLRALEERISRFRGPYPFHTGAVPTKTWVGGGAVLFVGLGASLEMHSIWPVYGSIVGLTVVACLSVALFIAVQLHRKKELLRMEEAQTECVARLRSQTAELLCTPMDLKLPTLRVSNTPHRIWLSHRIRELKSRHGDAGLVKRMRAVKDALVEGEAADLSEFRSELTHAPTFGATLDAGLS
jgi:hypothetical protein